MQGTDFSFGGMGYFDPFDPFFFPRSHSRSSNGSDSPSQGGGGTFAIDPQLLDSPIPNSPTDSQSEGSPYLPSIETPPHPSSEHLPPIGSFYPGSYPGSSFHPGSTYGQDSNAAGPSRLQRHSPSPTPPPHTLSQLYRNDGPPPEVPDAGPFLRRKYRIPLGVPINLDALSDPRDDDKPLHTLPTLTCLAIYGSPRKMLTLQEIYTAIEKRFEWYRLHPHDGWKGSIRHNLSLNLLFRKKHRPITEPGKGSYWYIDISSGQGNKRDRKRNYVRKVDKNNEEETQSVDVEVSSSSRRRTKAPSSARRGSSAPASVRPTRRSTRLARQEEQAHLQQQQQQPFSAPSPTAEHSFDDVYHAAAGLSNPRRERPLGYRPYSTR